MQIELDDYILHHSEPESALLQKLYRETHLYAKHPRMASGHIQGRFLAFVSQLVRPKRILEIGTFTGYSALCLAEGLVSDGKLITIEVDDELEDRIRKFIQKANRQNQIELIIGDAKQIIPKLHSPFDLVFIDGDKREYPDYLELVKPLLTTGALVIVDNVLWDGKVLESEQKTDGMTRGVQRFNDALQQDADFQNFMLPLRDGLSIARFFPAKLT
ncbi:MAG: O-methyltransferase [Bacteroidota bacterium]|nr:O-methyltransferase [Bacteroidota bacterium]